MNFKLKILEAKYHLSTRYHFKLGEVISEITSNVTSSILMTSSCLMTLLVTLLMTSARCLDLPL